MLEDRSYMRDVTPNPTWPQSIILIGVLVCCYVLQLVFDEAFDPSKQFLRLNVSGSMPAWLFQLFTYQFLHGGSFHLFINCLSMYFIGPQIEQTLGTRRFWGIYLLSGVLGGILHLALAFAFPSLGLAGSKVVGASAGICGLVACFTVLHWHEQVQFLLAFVIPVSIRGKYLLGITVLVAVIGLLERSREVAHAAHLGGLLGGFLLSKALLQGGFVNIGKFWSNRKPQPERAFAAVKTVSVSRQAFKKGAKHATEFTSSSEFMSKEVDPILDKISAQGIHSLTESEKRILEAARKRISRP